MMDNEVQPASQHDELERTDEKQKGRKRQFIRKLLSPLRDRHDSGASQSTSRSGASSLLSLTHKADDGGHREPASGVASVRSEKSDEIDQPSVGEAEKDTDDAQDTNVPEEDEIDMWAAAENKLRAVPEKRHILDVYDRILAARFGEELKPIGTRARREQFQRLFESEIAKEQHPETQGETKSNESKVKAKHILKTVAKAIVATKDVIAPATNGCLPAGVACTGLVVIVSFCLKAADQRDRLLTSLEDIAGAVCRVAEYEKLCRGGAAEKRNEPTAFDETKAAFTAVCCNILEFQARVLCFLQKSLVEKIVRNAVEYDGWNDLLLGIKDAEARIQSCAHRHQMKNIVLIYSKVDELISEQKHKNQARDTERLNEGANRFLRLLYRNTCPYLETIQRNRKRVRGTCNWFTHHALFNGWREARGTDASNILYVTADPGCGKSVLSAHLVDEVLTGGHEAVCYFFFKDDFEDQKTATGALCAILHQLFDNHRSLLAPDILNKFEARGESIVSSFEDLWQLLEMAATKQDIVCVFDALDECHEADMEQLTSAVARTTNPGIKFLLTSRPYKHIRDAVGGHRHIHLRGDSDESADEISKEIALVVDERVNKAKAAFYLDATECELLRKQISSVQNRTYLWVALVFDGLMNVKSGITKQDIVALTKQLPQGIDAAYEKILQKSQDREQTRRLLHLILGAERPLTLQEVFEALNVTSQKSLEGASVFQEERAKQEIRNLCGLFVTIVNNRVYLLHQTAREFLLHKVPEPASQEDKFVPVPERHGMAAITARAAHVRFLFCAFVCVVQLLLHKLWLFWTNSWEHSMDLTTVNETLTAACMACLQPGIPEDTYPSWYKYAAKFWPDHYRWSGSRFRTKMGKAARDLCVDTPLNRKWEERYLPHKDEVCGDGLGLASYAGLDGAVKEFLKEIRSTTHPDADDEINRKHGRFSLTALSMAAGNGHAVIVRLLLENGAEVDAKDNNGWTPLSYAAGSGNKDVVQQLLEKGAEVDVRDNGGRTPLSNAAGEGYKDVVQQLLEKGAEVDAKDNDGWTPLIYAASSGNKDVMQQLLEKGAEVDVRDNDGRTPLSYAASSGNKDVVQQLLEKGAEVDAKDNDGWTPLSYAASKGYKDVVQQLLEKGAEVDAKDNDGWTPLLHAASSGHKDVVQQLLEKGAKVDVKNNRGRTPLLHAVYRQKAAVVELLLDTNKVDTADGCYIKAMEMARMFEDKTIYKLLKQAAYSGGDGDGDSGGDSDGDR